METAQASVARLPLTLIRPGLDKLPVYMVAGTWPMYSEGNNFFETTVAAFSIVDLANKRMRILPLRKASFLTIVNALRVPQQDQVLYGGRARIYDKLKRSYWNSVTFGGNAANLEPIGFAPVTNSIEKNRTYFVWVAGIS